MLPGDGSLDSCVCWLKVTGGEKGSAITVLTLLLFKQHGFAVVDGCQCEAGQ